MRVSIWDFQSIREVSLEIEGFTVIVGDSNIGKSAILRAIYSALRAASGHDFVRTGAAFARVDIEDDDFHIRWEKGKAVNRYFINHDPNPFDKVNRAIPEAITKAGFSDILLKDGKIKLTPQHAGQRDGSYFLLDQTPGTVAEVLAQLSRLEVMMRATKTAELDIKRLKSESKLREKDLGEITAKIEKFAKLKDVSTKIDALRSRDVELRRRQATLEMVRVYRASLQVQRHILKLTDVPFGLSEPPSITQLVQVAQLVPGYRQATRYLQIVNKPIPEVGVPLSTHVLSQAVTASKALATLSKVMRVPVPEVPKIPSMEALRNVSEAAIVMEKARQVAQTIEREAAVSQQDQARLLEEIHTLEDSLGKCPLCERVFS